ncbi:hypothetical protein PR202_gb08007 [Eleusine coracana subsp. coracana]|uniref:Uncharacterized protein n=1 Tax=Eleusine coracana subsp. coracana TaxID=191504 RepID=A0AAV5EB52_ELECO|nr:hypothetical protein PR202_gb08007 [Eleusine coracana subsp. coracana]
MAAAAQGEPGRAPASAADRRRPRQRRGMTRRAGRFAAGAARCEEADAGRSRVVHGDGERRFDDSMQNNGADRGSIGAQEVEDVVGEKN